MKLKINVTARDIKFGTQGFQEFCPIARAAFRVNKFVKGAVENPSVENKLIRFRGKGFDEVAQFKLPPKAQEFIVAFDTGKKVKPFKFLLTK